jgi:hypothetical protein
LAVGLEFHSGILLANHGLSVPAAAVGKPLPRQLTRVRE